MKINIKKRTFFDASESATLSDLGFLLIIYFIVIAGFNINQGFMLNLPQKNSTKIVNVEDVFKVHLNNSSEILFDKKVININDLQQQINNRIKVRPNMTLLLKIYPEVPYQKVVDIINLARELKVDNFSFSMVKENE